MQRVFAWQADYFTKHPCQSVESVFIRVQFRESVRTRLIGELLEIRG